MSENKIRQRLEQGLVRMAVEPTATQQDALLTYMQLLEKWNKTYNLTAVREPLQMVSHHLLDSLSVHPHLHGQKIADIGSGAGLPGIPLAIIDPDRQFLLIDSNSKKTRFMIQAASQLGLKNVTIYHGRAEDYPAATGFDTVVCRALAVLPMLISIGGHLLNKTGVIVAQKGTYPSEELAQVPASWEATSHRISVPFLEEQSRHIIIMHERVS